MDERRNCNQTAAAISEPNLPRRRCQKNLTQDIIDLERLLIAEKFQNLGCNPSTKVYDISTGLDVIVFFQK